MAEVHAVADIAVVAELFADPSRARIVAALSDGRSLPASLLASEAGVAASTASEHLGRLVAGGVLSVRTSGRHRYYTLADDRVAAALEALAALAPQAPVRSLRESTRAAAMRRARTCYDHLAGRLGVAVTEALLHSRALVRDDGPTDTRRRPDDPLAAAMPVHPYRLGPRAEEVFDALGVRVDLDGSRRLLLRFCVDWSEQRHHLAGRLGADVLARFESAGWVTRHPSRRSLDVTDRGAGVLQDVLGIDARQLLTAASA